jgi:hypothetical protein
MADLFNRVVRVEVGLPGQPGRAWEGLRVGFTVKKSDGRTPNKAEITIYNLTADSSAAFQQKNAVVRLLAGYGAPSELFMGDIDRAIRNASGVDSVTKVEAADGGRKFRQAWISKTFAAGTTSDQVLRELATAAGLSLGYVSPLPTVHLTSGLTLNGSVKDSLDVLVKTVGADWSIQDGELQVLLPTATTGEEAVVISPDTGLIGSPVRTKDGIEVVSLLQPTLRPGRRFQLTSRDFKGIYRAKYVEHTGDSGWEYDFYTKITATPVG